MTGQESYAKPRQQFSSGRELFNAVKARREDAERFKALSKDVEAELASQLDQYDPELIQGVRVLWIREGRAARDETAFRHALKPGHRLLQAGQRMLENIHGSMVLTLTRRGPAFATLLCPNP